MKVLFLLSMLTVSLCISSFNTQWNAAPTFECSPEMRSNGICDLPCYYEFNDGDDCTRSRVCEQLAGDGFCDILCFSSEFDWDGGDCTHCLLEMQGDGHCDLPCLETLNKDGGDCLDCPVEWRGDGVCDVECLTSRGEWDRNDCYRDFRV